MLHHPHPGGAVGGGAHRVTAAAPAAAGEEKGENFRKMMTVMER
jgi:hypothetical protein